MKTWQFIKSTSSGKRGVSRYHRTYRIGKVHLYPAFERPDQPISGTVFVDGRDINKTKDVLRAVRFRVGLVFQYPEYQLFEDTVYKDIAFGPKNMKLSDNEIRERVYEAASFVGVPEEVLEKSPFELSGGQKRRVAIAGVVAMRPDVLILTNRRRDWIPVAGQHHRQHQTISQGRQLHRDHGDPQHGGNRAERGPYRCVQRRQDRHGGNAETDFFPQRRAVRYGTFRPGCDQNRAETAGTGVPVPSDVFTIEQLKQSLCSLKGGEGHA